MFTMSGMLASLDSIFLGGVDYCSNYQVHGKRIRRLFPLIKIVHFKPLLSMAPVLIFYVISFMVHASVFRLSFH
jgi:hypothetical protein